jgi:signal transduction histidine kinase
MSRITLNTIRLDLQEVDLSVVLNESIETLRTSAQAKGIRLQAVVAPLKEKISGDPRRLQQVFWNLLHNAIKFTPKDGEIRVELRVLFICRGQRYR